MKFSLLFSLTFIAFTIEAELTPDQKICCEQFTSVFEIDTIELQYAYVEPLPDGRGYTSGRAGFTTATGDNLEVVQKYTAMIANNPLAKYLPELQRLAEGGSGSIENLVGCAEAWKLAAEDVLFRQVQDEGSDQLYYR
jgi:chitosanase